MYTNNIMNTILSLFSQLSQEINIYFVRHAQSEYNKAHVIAGRTETPLTNEGVVQAEVTGAHFARSIPLSTIIYSPIGRSKHTAKIIHSAYNNSALSLIECKYLMEIHGGVLEKKKIVDIEKETPELFRAFKHRSWEAIPHAETITELLNRAQKMWHILYELAQQGNKHIGVVSHGGFMQWIFKTSFGMQGEHVNAWVPIVKISNCSVSCLKIEPLPNTEEQAQSSFATWLYINSVYY